MDALINLPTVTRNKRIGLVAGWGQYPITVAERLIASGYEVYCVAVAGHADPVLEKICTGYKTFGIGRLGAQTRYLRHCGCEHATMAGKIFKTRIIGRFAWIRHTPDLTFWKYFYRQFITGTEDRNDDSMLLTVTRLFSDRGIQFLPATDFAPELLVKKGTLTRRRISDLEMKDIQFGWRLAKSMGELDVGQSVVVKGRACIAVEAIEGTDACIRRAGELCRSGKMTVVKVAKPQQDKRFDMPTIGVGTLESMRVAGANVLAIEANMTVILEEEQVIKQANDMGISIVALDASEIESFRIAG
ncbi:MAG: UDP-2,3-diacylglucosamine diphosphatase LpxI [Pirellulaceae bacterium]